MYSLQGQELGVKRGSRRNIIGLNIKKFFLLLDTEVLTRY